MEDKLRVEESAGDHEACVPAAASPAMLTGEWRTLQGVHCGPWHQLLLRTIYKGHG